MELPLVLLANIAANFRHYYQGLLLMFLGIISRRTQTMTMELYHTSHSTCSQKVRLTLAWMRYIDEVPTVAVRVPSFANVFAPMRFAKKTMMSSRLMWNRCRYGNSSTSA